MPHTHYHGDIEVEWTDDEWKRLSAIKKWRDCTSERRDGKVVQDASLGLVMPSDLKEKLMAYAKGKGVSASALIRHACMILTQGDE